MIISASLRHENVSEFLGRCAGPNFGPYGALVSPWYENGDARRFLANKGSTLPAEARVLLWRGIVRGVAYLHEQNPPIVHGDLKPENVLVDKFETPKICDFGLARLYAEEGSSGLSTTSPHTGTQRYLAVELVKGDDDTRPTRKSDIWALGCIGLEIVFDELPFSRHKNMMQGRVLSDLRKEKLPASKPEFIHTHYHHSRAWSLIEASWNLQPERRPSATEMAQRLMPEHVPLTTRILARVIQAASVPLDWRLLTDTGWSDRYLLLRNLALVSKTYNRQATPFLYQQIRISNSRSGALLLKTLERQAGYAISTGKTMYGLHTINFMITNSCPDNHLSLSDIDERVVGIAAFLRHMPSLRELYMPVSLSRPWPFDANHTLLHAINHLGVLENLTTLVLFLPLDTTCRLPDESSFFPIHLPVLRQLCLFDSDSFQESSSLAFGMLSLWTMPVLRGFRFRTFSYYLPEAHFANFIRFLKTHGPSLQTLDMELAISSSSEVLIRSYWNHILNKCRSLETITWRCSTPSEEALLQESHATLRGIRLASLSKFSPWYSNETFQRFQNELVLDQLQQRYPQLRWITASIDSERSHTSLLYRTPKLP